MYVRTIHLLLSYMHAAICSVERNNVRPHTEWVWVVSLSTIVYSHTNMTVYIYGHHFHTHSAQCAAPLHNIKHHQCTYWIKEEGVEDGPTIASFMKRFFTSGECFVGYCVSEQPARLSGEHLKRRL